MFVFVSRQTDPLLFRENLELFDFDIRFSQGTTSSAARSKRPGFKTGSGGISFPMMTFFFQTIEWIDLGFDCGSSQGP
jgi:hypothetical protein